MTIQSNISTNSPIIILGAGQAGWSVIDAIRTKEKELEIKSAITLITTDSADRYSKPMLSTVFSQNKTADDLIRTSADKASKVAKITLFPYTEVINIDSANNQLTTDKGNLTYSKLVIATGAKPNIPDSLVKYAHHLNHLNGLKTLQKHLGDEDKDNKSIAVIGAGMVGTEIAEDLHKAGYKVHLIDSHTAPLSSIFPKKACQLIRNAIESIGVNYHPESKVSEVIKTDNGYQIQFLDSSLHDIDTCIVDEILACTGLKMDTTLADSTGITSDPRTGIEVQTATLQTSINDIYAIGDCMSIEGVPCRYILPLRPQASIIADELLGNEHPDYQHKSPVIRLKNKFISVVATGSPNGQGDWRLLSETTEELQMEQVENGKVTATVIVKQV